MTYMRARWLFLFVLLCFLIVPQAVAQSAYAAESDILISGRVTSAANGEPIPNVAVMLVDGSFPIEWVEGARTDADGNYTITTTPYSTWWIRFDPPDETHLQEFYNDFYGPLDNFMIPQGAEKFAYAPGLQRSGINAALRPSGSGEIRGSVVAPELDRSNSYVVVELFAEEGPDEARWLKQVDVSASGHYTLTDLAPGRYKLYLHVYDSDYSPPAVTYASEYYNNQSMLDAAAWIEVGAGEVVQAEVVELQLGGAITGIVTSSLTKGALGNIRAYAYDADNRLVTVNENSYSELGVFRVTNLPPGEYKIFFEDRTLSHRPEYYNDAARLEDAVLIGVEAGEVVSNIQAELTLSKTVAALATSPGLPNAIMMALAHDPVPRFTLDGGQQWQKVATTPWVAPGAQGTPYEYADAAVGLAPRPNLGGHRLIYLHDNLYRSGDEGATWAEQVPLHECEYGGAISEILEIYTVPTDPNRLYAIENCTVPGDWAGPQRYYWLLVSKDAGVTWEQISWTHNDLDVQSVQSVVVSPSVEDRVYVRVEGMGWFRSENGGESWAHLDFASPLLQLDADDADTLYRIDNPFDVYGGYYWGQRSDDGGATWQHWAEQPCPIDFAWLVAHPTEGEVLFLGCPSGLYRSTNGGDAWDRLATTPGRLLAPDYGVPGRLLWAKDDGLWASTDEGDSWQVLMPDYASAPAQARVSLYLPGIVAPDVAAEQ